MGIHFESLAKAIAHFQRLNWKPWLTDQNDDGSWKSAGFRKRYTDEDGSRSELMARFKGLPDGMVFVGVYDIRDMQGVR